MKSISNTQSKPNTLFDNPLWDVKEAALKLSVSQKTLRDWIYKKQIPFKKLGNLVRFVPSEIQKWIEKGGLYGNTNS